MSAAKKKPQQNRSRLTKDKLVSAAEDLFSRKGLDEVTTHQIAEKAGVSTGSFYTYFDNKKEILSAVLERASAGYQKEIEGAIEELGPVLDEEELIGELLRISLRVHRLNPRLARTVEELKYSEPFDPELQEPLRRYERGLVDLVKALLSGLEEKKNVRVMNLDAKAKVLAVVIESLCHESVFHDMDMDDDDLVREMNDLVMGYLDL